MPYGNDDGYGGPPVGAGPWYANPVGMAGGGQQPANLYPPGRAELGGPAGQPLPPFMRTPIWPPQLLLSTNTQVAHTQRDYTLEALNQTINVEVVRTIRFDIPCLVYAMTAAVENTAAIGTSLGGMGNLNTFLCSIEHANGDRLVTTTVLGGTIFGEARQPRLVGGNGWVFDRGSSMVFNITPLASSTMRININVWCIEERGPRNLTR